MNLLDTIAAVSTPHGKGGIAVIRISGDRAIEVGSRMFRSTSGKELSELPAGKMTYGQILMSSDGEDIDDGMAVVFRAPHSFTGEDTVEISCHGGLLITQKVLSSALSAGARAAEAGEFTRRSFISGKMDLTQAEALGNLLDAVSEGQLVVARNGMKGRLGERIDAIYSSLRAVLTGIYAAIDFPDEDLSEMSRDEMRESLSYCLEEIKRLGSTYKTGRAMSEGIPTVICGRTNAGKSSVYNRLLGYDAAIVTDIEGTTRDILKETASVGRVTLRLCDTAGLRETSDTVEELGIARAMKEINEASLVLAVFDTSREINEEDIALAEKIKISGVPAIALLNKSDAKTDNGAEIIAGKFEEPVCLSAKTGDGFEELVEKIEKMFIDGDIDVSSDAIVAGARQFAALNTAGDSLRGVISELDAGVALDICCVGVEEAMAALGEVDGRQIGEEIVGEIFAHFCVGK